MLKIQEFLECFDNVVEASRYLKKNLRIETRPHLIDGEYYVFSFIPDKKADLSNPIVKETNLLILDEDREVLAKAWNFPDVVTRPSRMPAYFSFGKENHSEEMPDGDLIVIYNIDGKWYICNRESPIGVTNSGFSHEEETIKLLEKRFGQWDKPFKNTNPLMCFIFCLVHPDNQKIMPIKSPELYLMGVINLDNYQEISYNTVNELANKMGFARPATTEINGTNSLLNRLRRMRTLSPGLMLRDKALNRIFLPNPIYVAMQKAMVAGSHIMVGHVASILQACRDKADVETINVSYKKIGPMLSLLWKVKEDLWSELAMLWGVASKTKTMIEFATKVEHHPLNHILFMCRDNKISSIRDGLDNLKPIKLYSFAKRRRPAEYRSAVGKLKEDGNNGE